MADFASQVRAFTDKAQERAVIAQRRIALEVFTKIILRTPVDRGRARGNWQVAIGAVPTGTLEINDRTGQATINKATAVAAGLEAGQRITMVNNLPYIERLEDGSSTQAPAGMVGLSVQEFQQIAAQVGVEVRML